MPWLLSEVKQEIKQMISSREILTGLSLFAQGWLSVLCLWFRESLIYINNCPTRCNTKQSIYYSASSPYMFRVSTTPITSTQDCNYSLRYWSYFFAATSLQRGQASLEGGSCTKIWPVTEAVVTVLCTHDGCGWHTKHVGWTCRIINRLLFVAASWTIINTDNYQLPSIILTFPKQEYI